MRDKLRVLCYAMTYIYVIVSAGLFGCIVYFGISECFPDSKANLIVLFLIALLLIVLFLMFARFLDRASKEEEECYRDYDEDM